MLLEIPPGLTIAAICASLQGHLKYVTASHTHEDHFDEEVWDTLRKDFRGTQFIPPDSLSAYRDYEYFLGGEPVWVLPAPKHSTNDAVVVFRGVAMTGDIELGQLESVNDEVSAKMKLRSMEWLLKFTERRNYHVHTIMSAHLNDIRQVEWADLFDLSGGKA